MQPTKILRRIAADIEKEVARMPGGDLNAGAGAYLDDAEYLRMFAAELDRYRDLFKGLSEITANFQLAKNEENQ